MWKKQPRNVAPPCCLPTACGRLPPQGGDTNGPSATIGEVLSVELPRPRNRVALADSAQYLHYRKAVIDFLYTRQAHVEKAA